MPDKKELLSPVFGVESGEFRNLFSFYYLYLLQEFTKSCFDTLKSC